MTKRGSNMGMMSSYLWGSKTWVYMVLQVFYVSWLALMVLVYEACYDGSRLLGSKTWVYMVLQVFYVSWLALMVFTNSNCFYLFKYSIIWGEVFTSLSHGFAISRFKLFLFLSNIAQFEGEFSPLFYILLI